MVSQQEVETLDYTTMVPTGLSILGSLFIIITVIKMRPGLGLFTFVFWLSVSDFMFCLAALITDIPSIVYGSNRTVFLVFDVLQDYFTGTSMIWSTAIAMYHYFRPTPKSLWKYHFIAWGIPLVTIVTRIMFPLQLVSIDLQTQMLSFSCTVVNCLYTDARFSWTVLFFLVETIICWSIVIGVYVALAIQRKKKREAEEALLMYTGQPLHPEDRFSEHLTSTSKVIQYNVVFAICYLPWIVTFFFSCNDPVGFDICAIIFVIQPLQGLFNAIIYGTSTEFIYYIKFGLYANEGI